MYSEGCFICCVKKLLLAVRCASALLKAALLFQAKCNASHYVYQGIPHGKLKFKKEQKFWDKFRYNNTPSERGTSAETLRSTCLRIILFKVFLLFTFPDYVVIFKFDSEMLTLMSN